MYKNFFKRLIDFTLSLIGLIILSPLFIIVTIALAIANGGKPFFLQPRPGCNEIITNGDNGWIVPSKNVDQLQERMEWCMTNREESKDMGRKSRAVMVAKYERTYVWGEILKEYYKQLEAIQYVKK